MFLAAQLVAERVPCGRIAAARLLPRAAGKCAARPSVAVQSVPGDGREMRSRPHLSANMLDSRHQKELAVRLRKIEGQIQGVQRMIAEPRMCVEILQQLAAAAAALKRVRVGVLRYHASKCVRDAIKRGRSDRTRSIDELLEIVDQFGR
jgi:DNA-binding FrmR family transcriptional regulator